LLPKKALHKGMIPFTTSVVAAPVAPALFRKNPDSANAAINR
jgi:hypothetical protein